MRPPRRELEDIPQSSLADVAFLLLIFFIATTIFPTEKGIPLVLPGSTSVKKPIPRKNVLQITTGRIYLDGVPSEIRGLRDEVKRRIEENPNLVVSIETDPDAPYGIMVDVLDEVKLANAERISIKLYRG